MEYNTGTAICETHIEVLSYVAYVRGRKALPYGRENCVLPFDQATREQVRGAVAFTYDAKGILFFRSPKPPQTNFDFIVMAT
jgi:hypothetical protein